MSSVIDADLPHRRITVERRPADVDDGMNRKGATSTRRAWLQRPSRRMSGSAGGWPVAAWPVAAYFRDGRRFGTPRAGMVGASAVLH